MALEGMLAKPFIERLHPAVKILGAVSRLKSDGLLKAHGLVAVEDAGRRQQTGELWDGPGGPIQDLDELIPGGLIEAKHPAVGERVLRNHSRRLDDEVSQRLVGLLGRQPPTPSDSIEIAPFRPSYSNR